MSNGQIIALVAAVLFTINLVFGDLLQQRDEVMISAKSMMGWTIFFGFLVAEAMWS